MEDDFETAMAQLRDKYRKGYYQRYNDVDSYNFRGMKVKKLTQEEFDLLNFCAGRDMRRFLQEEFTRNPIDLSSFIID